MGRISDGIDNAHVGDNSNKSILVRGCDPEMGRRAIKLLPTVLGNPEMVSITNDDDFITHFNFRKDVQIEGIGKCTISFPEMSNVSCECHLNLNPQIVRFSAISMI